jgi:hypothetical protein
VYKTRIFREQEKCVKIKKQYFMDLLARIRFDRCDLRAVMRDIEMGMGDHVIGTMSYEILFPVASLISGLFEKLALRTEKGIFEW